VTYNRAVWGDALDQAAVGDYYLRGIGIASDEVEALKWSARAAEAGESSAQNVLGCAYDSGKGVEKNAAKAVEWWTRAAEAGDSDAQYKLGCAYESGSGVAVNAARAVMWFKRAANDEDASAQLALATHLYHGAGVPRDLAAAAVWYLRATAADIELPGSLCWADEFAHNRDSADAYAAALRALAAMTRHSTAGVAAFLAAAARGACACEECASGMD
jgi:TPR repeat protein